MAGSLFSFRLRAKFLVECPENPTNAEVKAAAIRAGYSSKKAGQKLPKFRLWLAEEAKRRAALFRENPANRHSVISGKKLPSWLASSSEPVQPAIPEPKPIEQPSLLPKELDWWRDPLDGFGQTMHFDLEGRLVGEAFGGQPRSRRANRFADSYASFYIGLDGQRRIAGEPVRPPIFEGLDLSYLFAEEMDGDPLGDVDALPQAHLSKDESLSQQVILQMAKGTH